MSETQSSSRVWRTAAPSAGVSSYAAQQQRVCVEPPSSLHPQPLLLLRSRQSHSSGTRLSRSSPARRPTTGTTAPSASSPSGVIVCVTFAWLQPTLLPATASHAHPATLDPWEPHHPCLPAPPARYADRLPGKAIILLTSDAGNRAAAAADGLTALSLPAYARSRVDAPDLLDLIARQVGGGCLEIGRAHV